MKTHAIPIQLRDGSWIKLSDITAIICQESSIDGHKAAVEIRTMHGMVWVACGDNRLAREYADELGRAWHDFVVAALEEEESPCPA